ncbi:MAG: AmmeMemoRadiSam system radical SAM enzyme [Elusimicrobiota bacterium]|jgi:pyruvate formate lyase activating enzyme
MKTLEELTREGELYEKLPGKKLRCLACGHRCLIPQGKPGICRVRFNSDGRLHVPWGYVAALQLDPVEKKPFFHALPGSVAMSFGMLGCNFHCGYCQNWNTSQALRDPDAGSPIHEITPGKIVEAALAGGARLLTSTYNEPLITSEWGVAVFKEARRHGMVTSCVSNGNATPEVLRYLRPWVDLYKVDLKSFQDAHYRQLGGVLQPVLDSIGLLHQMGFWLEVVTLVVPGFNDSREELRDIARFLASVSPDIPWHVTAFHKNYQMTDPENTSAVQLLEAVEIGREAGLRFVYAGNLPGQVKETEHTACPDCRTLLIERSGFRVLANHLQDGRCPKCHRAIPGFWTTPSKPVGDSRT